MLEAFAREGIVESDLHGSTGYGYDDPARARYESLLARIFGAQRALARLSIVSGTHAIVAALAACTPPGTTLLVDHRTAVRYAAQRHLRRALLARDAGRRVSRNRVASRRSVDLPAVLSALAEQRAAAIFVQRSRGYAPRRSLRVDECARLFAAVKARAPDASILVDDCYGELVETREPTHVGADLAMGSLIKNLGGSVAPARRLRRRARRFVERVAARLYAPGHRRRARPDARVLVARFVQGLFLAPLIVEQCLRGLDFAAALFAELGYRVDPAPGAARTDIVQAIALGFARAPDALRRRLQESLPVNARFRPEPGAVPGYAEPVVMSSGAFVAGATIELSCDAPMRPPYEVYLQGGVTYAHACLGALLAARADRLCRAMTSGPG